MLWTTCLLGHAVGRVARWLSGCFCHQEIAEIPSFAQRQRALKDIGLADGFCCWFGRRGPSLALGGCEKMCDMVMSATCEGHRAALLRATESVRIMCLHFEQHVKQRWCSEMRAKLAFWQDLPYASLGLFGEFRGHSETAPLAKFILQKAEAGGDLSSMHRVTQHLFGDQVLMNQVRSVAEKSMSLLDLPELLSFLYRYAFLSVVGHFVEGRHRMISLQSSGSSVHTLFGGHSSLMRKDESNSLCQNPDFLNCVSVKWRMKGTLNQLLQGICPADELAGLSYARRPSQIVLCVPLPCVIR